MALRKLGYVLNLDELSQFEVEAFTLIASEFARLRAAEIEEQRKKSGRHRS